MGGFARRAAAAAAVLLLAACSAAPKQAAGPDGTPARPSAATSSPAASDGGGARVPASLTGQRLRWHGCADTAGADGTWQCATMKTPLDWRHPGGDTIGVALIRRRSSGPAGRRIGSLVFNFGGPGGSGVSSLPAFAASYAKLAARYDLVSFDPRGAGASEGVRCRSDKETAAAESLDLTPDTAAERDAYFRDAAAVAAGCERSAGRLLAHLSTEDTARDMELMRQVLGDDTLHYFGISYGTELGGTYAHLFPRRVGRMVLDAVVDPAADSVGHAENQARGFQRALDDYLKSRGQDPKRGTADIAALLDRLDATPLPTRSGRKLTESLAVTGITVSLYSEATWPTLTRALAAARDGDGTALLALADVYDERDSSGHYGTTSQAQRAISCRDDRQRPTPAQARRQLAHFRDISPVFGPFLGWDTAGWCHDWPVPGLHDTPQVSAPGAPPVLVVGNRGDPATPYEGAGRMAEALGSGVLLTWDGEGHGAYGGGSACVDGDVNTYLLTGRAPKSGTECA
ncbi:alpha/beta hydrolase [Streptomyces sp. NPDC050560]|uniref:alpha/beta hydrolase n=1 Tax=Streptomyces sp. NPDC050560 TaxID=3365630 RepID=UPI0037AC8185